jgi:CDP-glucose 4,6-dehydratase
LAEQLYLEGEKYAQAWNFGPEDTDCKSVQWILDELVSQWGDEASWMLDKNPHPHEARFLKLDCSKAKVGLNWYPKWEIGDVLQKIVNWQHQFRSGADMQAFCLNEIKTYSN